MKKVKETMTTNGASEDEVKEFEKGAQGFAKKIIANFKDYEFLIGTSMDPDAMYVYCLLNLQVYHQANINPGLFSSTTVRTVPPLTLPCGSTALSPPRCKRFILAKCGAKRCKAGSLRAFTKLLSSSVLRAISQDEHYGRHDFGNNLRFCLSLSTQKLKLSFLFTVSFGLVDVGHNICIVSRRQSHCLLSM